MNPQQILSLSMTLALLAPSPVSAGMAIGAAAGPGRFEINKRAVAGTGTIQAGDEVRTSNASSTVRLSSGTRLDVAPRSAISLYERRAALAAGTAEVRPGQGFEVEAGSLLITSETMASSKAVVRHLPGHRVMVSAEGGSYRVRNASGVLIARVRPGQPLLFSASTEGASSRLVLNGIMEAHRGQHFLTDETAAIRFQLQGNGLEEYTGRRVQVQGRLTGRHQGPPDTPQLVEVAWVAQATSQAQAPDSASADDGQEKKKKDRAAAAAAGAGAAGTAGAAGAAGAAAAGISTGAIVAGVSVAAAGVAASLGIKAAVTDDAPSFTPQTISQ